jgi:hypothetical protein
MAESADPWQEGQQAWWRLATWYQNTSLALPGQMDDGDLALAALSDLGLIRRLLEQAEFEAVRAARAQGKPWSEIAVRLGVTRQSAWERWRDVDDAPPPAGRSLREVSPDFRVAAARDVVSAVEARARRRRSSVPVPNVVGMQWDVARKLLLDNGLNAVGPDPDGPPLGALGWPDGVVTDQSPESGAMVPPGSSVTLWIERGGGSGVREPRRPKPDPTSNRQMRDEVTDESVS